MSWVSLDVLSRPGKFAHCVGSVDSDALSETGHGSRVESAVAAAFDIVDRVQLADADDHMR